MTIEQDGDILTVQQSSFGEERIPRGKFERGGVVRFQGRSGTLRGEVITWDDEVVWTRHAEATEPLPAEVEEAIQVLCEYGFPRAEVEHSLVMAFGNPSSTIERLGDTGRDAIDLAHGMPEDILLEEMRNSEDPGAKAVALTASEFLRERREQQEDPLPEVSAESVANSIDVSLDRLDNWAEEDWREARVALYGPGGWKTLVENQVQRMRATSDLQEVTDLLEARGYEDRAKEAIKPIGDQAA